MPTALEPTPAPVSVSLDDKWEVARGRIFLNGTQAIARALLAQAERDRRAGFDTAGYVSGYRGSPLGHVDTTLWSIGERLRAAGILFVPGVNEDLAATAVRGTQQLEAVPGARREGVFAAWYGKGPGVDRSIDALKHGNFAGAHAKGGVLAFYGDDHGGKSSSIAHQSEQAMASALIPSFYPADVGEIVAYSLMGYALSRFSGSWVGIKCVNEVVEQTATVDIDLDTILPVFPPRGDLPPEGVHNRRASFSPLREEEIVADYRLPLVQRFVRANRIDRTVFRSADPRLGLVTAGKSYTDTRAALAMLGLDDARAMALGVSLYKVGCIWPLEPEGLTAFAADHDTLFVIEEKKSFIELQVADVLFNRRDRPQLIGKRDMEGRRLLPATRQLEPIRIALAIADQLASLGMVDAAVWQARDRLQARLKQASADKAGVARSPFFCSGCPHARSTRVPEGSLGMAGIGCHGMVGFVRPDEMLLPTHMGGEGLNWVGLAPFTDTPHIFQNMGDGTYYHSGLLAIRAAIAAGVNITYKILYNDAVAMTGGQPVDGPISVAEIAQQLHHEGVRAIVIVSDDPKRHRAAGGLPPGTRIAHRDTLDAIQRTLRETAGCTVLIYDQTCAAEKRRRRKRGQFPDPPRRLFIAEAVCEGCGDCSVQSTCVSLMPVETPLGTKRQIDQSSCNKDYSCLDGFCPSFISVEGAEPRKGTAVAIDPDLHTALPPARRAVIGAAGFNLMVAGIGGTGVITVGAILGMAVHIEGRAASLFDMTGLAQKNGAVYSHIRIAEMPTALHAPQLGRGEADLLLAFDLVAGVGEEAISTLADGRSRAVVNGDVAPTVAFQFDRHARVDSRSLVEMLRRRLGEGRVTVADATSLATALLGDSIGANLFLVGVAAQLGLLPVGTAAIEQAVRLNGVAVTFNLGAFRLGRLFVADPEAVEAMLPQRTPLAVPGLPAILAHRERMLEVYQDAAYAARYRSRVEQMLTAEEAVVAGSTRLTAAVAHNYAKLLAYKDEYEVARLLSDERLHAEIGKRFAPGAKLSFHLAPPVLGGKPVNGRSPKRKFAAAVILPMLKLLAGFKRLRGTPFDLFGYSAERRSERKLICDYEATLDEVAGKLTADNFDAAITLLSLPDGIRGFGPVKTAAVARYYRLHAEALKRFDADLRGHDEEADA